MPPTASGIVSEPKQNLREMLAECASWRSFLGVGANQAAALQKTYTDFLFGDETLELARPFGIVTFPKLLMKKHSVGLKHNLWPRMREIVVQMFCDDPGKPEIAQGKVPIVEIETGTLTLENFIGNLFSELAELAALDARLAIDELEWDQNWVRTKPTTWPSEASQCYSFFTVRIEW